MIKIIRTNSGNQDFINLVIKLDQELKVRDGDDHAFYNQYNSIDQIVYVVVAYNDGAPVGCGAIKEYERSIAEVKRMFVSADFRGNGIASKILSELETWSKELQFWRCILETGVNQPEAIGLYRKKGYRQISNYGQYTNAINSLCFEKIIT